MPLYDHFRPPFADIASWEEFHGQWPAVIVQQLRKTLPAGYVAGPHVHLGPYVEVDIAAFETETPATLTSHRSESNGGTATATWAPPDPTLTLETDMADCDEYEVRIYDARRGRRLVAVIEIISPANKDRPEHRQIFVTKCAALLRQRISVVLIDLVTVRDFNLYDELLQLIGEHDPSLGAEPSPTYVVACRWRPHGIADRLETWNQPLTVGQPLPRVPLWLTDELAVPLDLEATYEQTCRDLWIT